MMTRNADLLKMTNEVVVAFFTRNAIDPAEVADLMRAVHTALGELAAREPPFREASLNPIQMQKPAVPVSESITPDFLVCIECGRRLKSLRFHLRAHRLSPASYRAKWGLPLDYPMVAPQLGQKRSTLAYASNFGHYRKLRVNNRQPVR